MAKAYGLSEKDRDRVNQMWKAWNNGSLIPKTGTRTNRNQALYVYIANTTEEVEACDLEADPVVPIETTVELVKITDELEITTQEVLAYNIRAITFPEDTIVELIRDPLGGRFIIVSGGGSGIRLGKLLADIGHMSSGSVQPYNADTEEATEEEPVECKNFFTDLREGVWCLWTSLDGVNVIVTGDPCAEAEE